MTSILASLRIVLLTFLFVGGILHSARGQRVAVTVDDLPGNEKLDIRSLQAMTDKILAALRSHGVPTIGFVTGKRVLVHDQIDERIEILERWMNAGATLGNHTFSHVPLSTVSLEKYKRDIIKGEFFPAHHMAERGQKLVVFRAPKTTWVRLPTYTTPWRRSWKARTMSSPRSRSNTRLRFQQSLRPCKVG